MNRRSYLVAAGLGTLSLAGCVGAPAESPDSTVLQLGPLAPTPQWDRGDPTESVGYVARFDSRDEMEWLLGELDAQSDRVTEFVDATDFETATVLYIQSVGPNTCYAEIDVTDRSVTDEAVVATASAVDTSEGDVACGEAITYPAALVRVAGDDLPAAARVTLTNGWGTTAELDADGPVVDPANLAGGVRPDGDPPAVPAALNCGTEGFERHADYVDDDAVTYGTLTDDDDSPTFALRVRNPGGEGSDDSLSFERGEEIAFQLVNVSKHSRTTGNEHKYSFQLQTEAGWEEIRGTVDDSYGIAYNDIGFRQPPGEGFEWSFELTERGLLAGHPHEDDLTICPDLQPGRYRFVYWGIPDGPLAVQFDYTG